MKEVTLKIPENKIEFFLELVKHLGFEVLTKWKLRTIMRYLRSTNPLLENVWQMLVQKIIFPGKWLEKGSISKAKRIDFFLSHRASGPSGCSRCN
jgi:hypothetical protein